MTSEIAAAAAAAAVLRHLAAASARPFIGQCSLLDAGVLD